MLVAIGLTLFVVLAVTIAALADRHGRAETPLTRSQLHVDDVLDRLRREEEERAASAVGRHAAR